MNELTQDRLIDMLDYNPDTGDFIWIKISGRMKPGYKAGCIDHYGYVRISLDGVAYQGHRLAWFYVYGEWPSGEIDHINGNRSDNRILNFRDVTRSINGQNQLKANRANKLGLLGVSKDRNKFKSTIWVNGKQMFLGNFDTPILAHNAYIEAKRKHHEGCTI